MYLLKSGNKIYMDTMVHLEQILYYLDSSFDLKYPCQLLDTPTWVLKPSTLTLSQNHGTFHEFPESHLDTYPLQHEYPSVGNIEQSQSRTESNNQKNKEISVSYFSI